MRKSQRRWLLGTVIQGVALCALGVTASAQNGPAAPPALIKTAVTLRADGIYDFSGRVVQCAPGQQVGIFAEGARNIVVQNAVIRGCQVGVLTAGVAAKVTNVDVRDADVCMLVSGKSNTITHNISRSCSYGIVVAGDDNTISDNDFNDNAADGILVTGHSNVIADNTVLRNAGVGIHLVRTVPMVADDEFVAFIQNFSAGNVIQGNTAADNAVDLVEFGDCGLGLRNEWTDNHFKSGSPDCIN
jgi:parallel beta-helix repeat protein